MGADRTVTVLLQLGVQIECNWVFRGSAIECASPCNYAINYARNHDIQLIMEKLECLTHIEVMTPVKNSAWYQGYVFSRPLLVSTPNAVFGLPRKPLQRRDVAIARRA